MKRPFVENEQWIKPLPESYGVRIDRNRLAAACYDAVFEIIGDKYRWMLPILYNEAMHNMSNYSDDQLLLKINRIVNIFDVYRLDIRKLIDHGGG